MGKITINMSMSLDGFIAAKNDSAALPLGEDGEQLHEWLFRDDAGEYIKIMAEAEQQEGAVIIGRRTYDNAHESWSEYGPAEGVPSFVLSHDVPERHNAHMTFVTDGLDSALEKARAAAGDKNIDLMGAHVQQQFLAAGLVDEITINVVPVLLKEGVRLFDNLGEEHVKLRQTDVQAGDQVTHITYEVLKAPERSKRS